MKYLPRPFGAAATITTAMAAVKMAAIVLLEYWRLKFYKF